MLYNQKEEISDDLKELINLGLFIVFDKKLELYHGRARLQNEQGKWEVDPNFDNSGNATGNRNIFGIKTISTGTKEIAEKFANNRVKAHSNSTAEIHRIYPIAPNSLIFNRLFDMEKLTEQDKNKLYRILRKVNIEDTLEAVPVPFEYRNIAKDVFISLKYELKSDKESYLTDKIVEKVSILLNVEQDIVSSIAGVINAKKLLTYYPKKAIVRFGLEEDELERFSFDGQNGESCPFNPEFVAYWLIKNNVIGLKSRVYSGTLNKKIEVCYLFDITKVNTLKAINNKIYAINQEYGSITKLFETCFKNKQLIEFLQKLALKNWLNM